jgi:phage recombination protein Bet
MNNVVVRPFSSAAAAFTSRQLDTIKRTVAADCNNDEFDLYIEYARMKGLDPFSKQVIPIVFSKDTPAKRRMSIVTTQDGQRVLAARCGDYRPAEEEPTFEIDEKLKGPTNPLGIVKCTTKLWKQDRGGEWHPVQGWAYWEEYAPLREEADEYEWIETGETWPDSGKPKKRKQKKVGAAIRLTLDSSGNWARMPRVMIAKCATMQALRAGWPDTFGGVVGEEEVDRARALDLSATEIVEQEREEQRMKIIAASQDEFPFVDDSGMLIFVSAGRFGEHILNMAHGYKTAAELRSMKDRNREGWNRYWAKHKGDALQVKAELEKVEAKLT